MLYWIYLFFNLILIIALNLILNFSCATLFWLFVSFAVVLLPSLPIAILIRKLPEKWFDYRNKIFIVSEKETNFYKKIKIRSWKDKIPEAGVTANFRKDHIYHPNDLMYIKRFILETCYSSILHISCIITALLFSPLGLLWNGFWVMTLPIAIVYSVLNIPSFFIQRYNRPRLIKKYERMNGQEDVGDLKIMAQNNVNI